MQYIRPRQWRLFNRDVLGVRTIVDFDLSSWLVGFDFCVTFGVYLGPLCLDFQRVPRC